MQLDAWADRIVDTAHREDLDPATKKVICDSYKWILSKLRPERYGDRLLVPGDPVNPIEHLHRAITPAIDDLTEDQLYALQTFCERMMIEQKAVAYDIQD